MNLNTFKKLVFIPTVLLICLISYLAFIRNTSGDTSTTRNAAFLGLKSTDSAIGASNQDKLSIDDSSSESTNTNASDKKDSNNIGGSNNAEIPKFYTVKEGDTYGCIAEKNYGSYEHWPEILSANIIYGHGYSEIELHVGAVVELPEILKENLKPASNLCS